MSEIWIYTSHPDLEGPPVRRTLASYVNLYEKKGWVVEGDGPQGKKETPREAYARIFPKSVDEPVEKPKSPKKPSKKT